MIDWLTLRCEIPPELHDAVREYRSQRPELMKWTPATGVIEYATPCHENIRSDSHQITVKVGGCFTVQGSPARSMGHAHNVFGSDDLVECARAHLLAAQKALPFELPPLNRWHITRVDVTHNYDLGGLTEVKQALAYLRQTDAGRYKVRTAAESVYWSPGSSMRSGKAYAKGPHLRYQARKEQAAPTERELRLADRLLRLELKLGNEFWRRRREEGISDYDADLQGEFARYFSGLIGAVEVTEMNDLDRIRQVAPTEGQALAAHRTWCVIRSIGHQAARESMPHNTWYRHKRILMAAGFSWADLAAGKVVEFRRRALVLERPITSWDEIKERTAA